MHLGSRIRAVAFASAGMFLVAACGGGGGTTSENFASADKQILRANPGTEPNSYDPTQQTYSYEAAVGAEVFEALLKATLPHVPFDGWTRTALVAGARDAGIELAVRFPFTSPSTMIAPASTSADTFASLAMCSLPPPRATTFRQTA